MSEKLGSKAEGKWKLERLTIRRGTSNPNVSGVSNSSISHCQSGLSRVFTLRSGDQISNTRAVDVGDVFKAATFDFSNKIKDEVFAAA